MIIHTPSYSSAPVNPAGPVPVVRGGRTLPAEPKSAQARSTHQAPDAAAFAPDVRNEVSLLGASQEDRQAAARRYAEDEAVRAHELEYTRAGQRYRQSGGGMVPESVVTFASIQGGVLSTAQAVRSDILRPQQAGAYRPEAQAVETLEGDAPRASGAHLGSGGMELRSAERTFLGASAVTGGRTGPEQQGRNSLSRRQAEVYEAGADREGRSLSLRA